MNEFIYNKPINVYFEITIACDLKCKHCRAEAISERSFEELEFGEIKKLVYEIKQMGTNLVVSGGDPLKREDLFDILEYAQKINLPVAITPTTSPLSTFEKIRKMKKAGIYALGISLDGSSAKAQDSFRGVDGTFENSINVLNYAKQLNIPVQVNTTFTKETFNEIPKIYNLLQNNFSPPVKRWSIFFLIPIGRGKKLNFPSRNEIKQTLGFLYRKSKKSTFHITTTEAPFYKAFYILKEIEKGKNYNDLIKGNRKMAFGVRDGNGVVFISHRGDIYPAGFLPLKLGNVREKKISEVYRNHLVMKNLRNVNLLKGKCGRCEFKKICGGSRARAYATKEDYLEEDEACFL